MSIYSITPSETDYTLHINLPCGSPKEITFAVNPSLKSPKEGVALDVHSQNGTFNISDPFSFITEEDVINFKKGMELPLPSDINPARYVVIDIKDPKGTYMDMESIRQS